MAGIQTEVKPKKKTSYQTAMFSKIDQFAQTPPDVMEHIQKVFNKGNKMYDPCPANRPEGFDGLSDECEWKEVNYVNPPYKSVEPWLVRGLEEVKKGKKVVYLIPARCDVEWWHKYILPNATSIYFIKQGIRFQGYKRKCPFAICVVVFTQRTRKSRAILGSIDFYIDEKLQRKRKLTHTY